LNPNIPSSSNHSKQDIVYTDINNKNKQAANPVTISVGKYQEVIFSGEEIP
jgi:hypothetical protein